MPLAPLAGVLETTNTTGTGTYTLAGAQTGYRAFGAGQNAGQFHYVARTTTQWEEGLGTYTDSTRAFTRDQILANHLGNTSPVNWGSGSKDFFSVIAPERVAMTDVANIWRAIQLFRGNTCWYDNDDDTGFVFASDDIIKWYANGAELLNFDGINRSLVLTRDDSGASSGPYFELFRQSVSPASGDDLGYIKYTGRDSANAILTYAQALCRITDATAGTADGELRLQALLNGVMTNVLALRGYAAIVDSGVDLYTGGKISSSIASTGVELHADGSAYFTTQDGIGWTINRKGSDGTLADLRRDGTSIGSISVSSGVVSYNAFLGSHYSDWHESVPDPGPYEQQGTVVRVAPGSLGGIERLSLVAPTTARADRRVLGVVGSRQLIPFGDRERSVLMVHALGTSMVRCIGPVAAGDLLQSGDLPGVACAQDDDLVRSSTIGKAIEDSPDDGERLVPLALMAG